MKSYSTFLILLAILISSCGNGDNADAYGNFEATTIIVSAKGSGELKQFDVSEGSFLERNAFVGLIDTTQLHLEKLQLKATLEALDLKLQEAAPEIAILLESKRNLERERNRTHVLFKQKAATKKQLDDYNGEIDVINQRIASTKRSINVANRAILSERKPLEAQIKILEKKIKDHLVENPIDGVVLSTFSEAHEFVNVGAPLFKTANLKTMKLKAYTTAVLLQGVRLNDEVIVRVDKGDNDYKEFLGTVTYIASEAEFTPKTIETKEERVNLVYAIEVKVRNDGSLKIGMPGEVIFKKQSDS